MSIHVYHHACERYQQRVEPCTLDEAKARIMAAHRAIKAAAGFGCSIVRLACGARLVLDGENVVTVFAPRQYPRQCKSPFREGGRA
jgi:hypothetical protein